MIVTVTNETPIGLKEAKDFVESLPETMVFKCSISGCDTTYGIAAGTKINAIKMVRSGRCERCYDAKRYAVASKAQMLCARIAGLEADASIYSLESWQRIVDALNPLVG